MSSQRRDIEDTTAARLAEIVAAAERAAKGVIDEAEAEARSRLSDAHEEADRIVTARLAELAALTEEIEAQAEALRRGAEALQAALGRARAEFGGAESLGGSTLMGHRESDPAPVDPPTARGDDADRRAGDERPTAPSLTVVAAPEPPAPEVGPSRAAEPTSESEPIGTPAGARLLATQMAVSGSSREEIEARLRSGFAIADATAILDAILGPER